MKRKIEKGKYLIFIALFLSMIYIVQIVSAASIVDDLNAFVDGTVAFFNPFSAKLLGDTPDGKWLFAKVMFFIIVLSMVWLALSKIPFFNPDEGAQLWVIWVVSIAVSLVAVRFIGTTEWIATIILPYSTLGIVLAAGFPFVIYFILIDIMLAGPKYKTIRKVAWVFFAVVFMGLFVSRGDEVGSARNIYFVTAIIAFIVSIMDGTFQRMLHDMSMDRLVGNTKSDQIDVLNRELRLANHDFARGIMNAARYHAKVADIRKRIRILQKS